MADLAPAIQDAPAAVGADDSDPRAHDQQVHHPDTEEQARDLLTRHPVADGLNGLPRELRLHSRRELNPGLLDLDLDLDIGEVGLHTDIPRLRAGRVGAQFWSVSAPEPDGRAGDHAVSATLEEIDFVHALVRTYPDALRLALTADGVAEARKRGRIASLLAAGGGHSIDSSLGTLRALFGLGVRRMALVGERSTPWADAAADEPRAGGLTRFGEEVVREMNRLGMLVDLSHSSPAAMRRAIAVSKAPVVFSHSAARAITDHPANVPDDVLAQLAARGGICMVTFETEYVSREATGNGTVRDVADHLDHIRAVVGPDHTGIGAAYDSGCGVHPAGLEDTSCYPRLIAELLNRGWTDADLAKLTWQNTLRVMRDAEFTARTVQQRRAPSTATIAQLDG
ncbi:dipeptidase [Streptomyces sp. NPDC004647]|uniref:dipeptidase n=1 Tax=Streptomyces sp. NPDC004647 TaxID=3154671 RepID=UPI00339E2B7B